MRTVKHTEAEKVYEFDTPLGVSEIVHKEHTDLCTPCIASGWLTDEDRGREILNVIRKAQKLHVPAGEVIAAWEEAGWVACDFKVVGQPEGGMYRVNI